MPAILVNYNYRPDWFADYAFAYTVYDRSTDSQCLDGVTAEVIHTENRGNIDYDKLGYLIDNYDTLPDLFLWGKTNLFQYITKPEFDTILAKDEFAPLLTQNHTTYADKFGPVCYYQDGLYYERNDSWYLHEQPARFDNWQDWAREFQLPNPQYLPFPPGGNFLLTRERVHRYSVDYYEKMRATMGYTQLPGEAQLAERSYYLMWK